MQRKKEEIERKNRQKHEAELRALRIAERKKKEQERFNAMSSIRKQEYLELQKQRELERKKREEQREAEREKRRILNEKRKNARRERSIKEREDERERKQNARDTKKEIQDMEKINTELNKINDEMATIEKIEKDRNQAIQYTKDISKKKREHLVKSLNMYKDSINNFEKLYQEGKIDEDK